MKLTVVERNKIYKEALKILLSHKEQGLCLDLNHAIIVTMDNKIKQYFKLLNCEELISFFEEIIKHKPKRNYKFNYWFEKSYYVSRENILIQAIKETE